MRTAALALLFIPFALTANLARAAGGSAPAKAANAAPAPASEVTVYHDIDGQQGWKCADFMDGRDKSRWYKVADGPTKTKDWDGNCWSWQGVTSYRDVPGWPGWKCADLQKAPARSRWYKVADTSPTAKVWEGSCDKWKK